MDMEEIILEHMAIRDWVDRFVKEALKEIPKDRSLITEESSERASA